MALPQSSVISGLEGGRGLDDGFGAGSGDGLLRCATQLLACLARISCIRRSSAFASRLKDSISDCGSRFEVRKVPGFALGEPVEPIACCVDELIFQVSKFLAPRGAVHSGLSWSVDASTHIKTGTDAAEAGMLAGASAGVRGSLQAWVRHWRHGPAVQ